MAQAVNIVVKNAAAIDKTFAIAVPAAGENPAVWLLREGSNPGVYPRLEISSRPNATRDSRKVIMTFTMPQTVTGTDGTVKTSAKELFNMTLTLPDFVSDTVRDDANAYIKGFFANAMIGEILKTGYSAT